MTERRGTKALELWCRRMVEGYPGVKIDNMTTSWRDGLAFCAIIHHFRPELIDFAKLTKGDIYRNNDLAFTVAEKHLGIPALLEPGDMVEYEVPDRLSILTYLAQFYRAFATTQGSSPSRIVPKRPAATSERGIVSPASTSPPTKMISRNGGAPRRDPCARCGLPVFIAERLNVGKCLYHRTCFRCARCNGQLSLVNYYETDSSQFCCETCPDEVSEDLTSKEPEPVQTKSLSDEEKSASLEKKQALDTYSSIFENALEAADDTTLKKDSTLSSQFVSARSHFLTAQVEDLSGSDTEMELPELPKTKPPDLKPRPEELKKDDNGKNSDVLCVTKNNSVNTDSDLKSDVNRTKNSDQLQAANRSNSYRDKNVITKDNSVRSRLKFYEPSVEEKNVNDKTCPVNISTSSPISESGNMLTTITNLCLSPIALSPNTANTKNNLKTDENLNTEPLKKSHTSPSLIDLAGKKAGAELTRQSIEDLSKAHQPKFIDDKKNVSALDDKLVDVGVIESAPVIHNVESHSTTVDDHVSDQLVEKDNSEVLGDGDLEQDEKPTRSDDTLEDLSTSNSVIVIDADTSTDNSRKHVSQSGDEVIIAEDSTPVIEISDETKSVIEISDDKTEDYPEDLNPFGDDSTEDNPPAVLQKSLNPFDEDEEETVEKPTPAVRKNLPSSTEKKVKSLNPFDEDSDEEDQIKKEVPKTNEKKKIAVLKLQNENDTPDTLFVKRISISPSQVQYSKPGKKVLAAPRISLNPVWSDVDDDGDEDEKTKLPVPTPRKLKSSTLEQNTPERKLKDQENPSAFGSSSSLSSANSGGQSVRKKKPAPRPPILSPDKQESTHSSLTSSPSTSAQHSPRLSASKNRKTKRAPPPPTLRPKDLSVTTEELSFIEQQNLSRKDWDKEKDIKDEENRNRQSLILANPIDDSPNSRQSQGIYLPNKSTYGKWKKKKGPAPSRPILQKRTIKQLPILEIKKELDVIELQQQGLEKQGVRLEQIIRERCEGPQVDPNEVEPIDVDDLMLQLFEVVNEKNELCRRQAELMYLRRQHRLEEEYADVEYQIRCLMNQTEANKTDTDKAREEELIMRLVEIVEKRNEIVECLEIDRLREHDEDTSISQSMNTYAAKRDEIPTVVSEEDSDKKDKKKKKKLKLKLIKKTDLDKDIDESESGSQSSNKEKKKKKFTLF